MEAFAEEEVAILGAGDFDVAIAGENFVHEAERSVGGVERFVEGGGEQAAFEAGGAEDGLLGEGGALEREKLLGVDGLVKSDQIFAETGDFVEIFEADHCKAGGGKTVFPGILGRTGFAFGGAGAAGKRAVAAAGLGLLFGAGGLHVCS